MEQTTRQTQQGDLVQLLLEKGNEIKALRRRVGFLESRLEQRIQLTQNLYQKRREHFNRMQDLAYRIFKDNPKSPFSYEELCEEWKRRYPNISSVNVPRRVKELTQRHLLWRVDDPETHKVYHYLRLEELKDGENSG